MCLATCGPCNIYIFCLKGNAHSNPLSVYLLDYYFFNGNSSAYSLDIRFLIHSGYKIHGAGWLINTNLFFKVLHIGKFKNKAKHHVLCHTSNSLRCPHMEKAQTELWSLVSKGGSSTPKSREFKNLSPKDVHLGVQRFKQRIWEEWIHSDISHSYQI